MTHRTYGYWSHAYAAVVEVSHTKHSDFSSPEITKERELNLFVTCWQLLSCRNVQGFFSQFFIHANVEQNSPKISAKIRNPRRTSLIAPLLCKLLLLVEWGSCTETRCVSWWDFTYRTTQWGCVFDMGRYLSLASCYVVVVGPHYTLE